MEYNEPHKIPRKTIRFLSDLSENNNREWFAENRVSYVSLIQTVSMQFCEALASKLAKISGTECSFKVYKIHRDLRFSKDKTPYNTHLRATIIPNGSSKLGPAWHFSLEHDKLKVGAGVAHFDKTALENFRMRVAGDDGHRLETIIGRLLKLGFSVREPELKRIPLPHSKAHIHGEQLRRKSLMLWYQYSEPYILCTDEGWTRIINSYRELLPLMEWLTNDKALSTSEDSL